MLYCKRCKGRFSEHAKARFFSDLLWLRQKSLEVLDHIGESCGVRKTSRLTSVNKRTPSFASQPPGGKPCTKDAHDELVAFFPPDAGGPIR